MAEAPLTVNTLLGLPDKEFADRVAEAGAGSEVSKSMKDRILKRVRGLQWKAVEGQVRRKSGELLEVDLMSLIASAWRQSKVTDRLAEEHKDKAVNANVSIPDHFIRTQLDPSIEIRFDDYTQRIVLNVSLDMWVTGIILNIEDSIIKAIEAGFIRGSGEIKIAHVPIRKQVFGPIDLPGKVNLGKGIPLRRPAADPGREDTGKADPGESETPPAQP